MEAHSGAFRSIPVIIRTSMGAQASIYHMLHELTVPVQMSLNFKI